MLEIVKGLVKDKEEIMTEEIKTVKMIVPMSFELKDGKCSDEETQALYDFLIEREEVSKETDEEEDEAKPLY